LATLSHTLPRLMRAAERQRRRQEVDSRRPFTIRLTAGSCTTPDDAAVPALYLTKVSLESYAETYARRSRDRPSLYLALPSAFQYVQFSASVP
jgi:hypothetical protein